MHECEPECMYAHTTYAEALVSQDSVEYTATRFSSSFALGAGKQTFVLYINTKNSKLLSHLSHHSDGSLKRK